MMKRTILCLSSLVLPMSAATLVDFNTPGTLDQFSVAGGSSGVSTWQDGAGFDGTGGMAINDVTRTHAFVFQGSFPGTTTSWYTSVLFRPGHASEQEFTLGFATGQNVHLSGNYPATEPDTPDLAKALGSIHTNFSALGIELRAAEEATSTSDYGASLTPLAVGTWYKAALAVTFNGGNSYTARASIFSVDASGNESGELVFKAETFNNSSLSADGSVYNYFGVVNNTGGNLDNFTTHIPEPAGAFLAVVAGAILLPMRRR